MRREETGEDRGFVEGVVAKIWIKEKTKMHFLPWEALNLYYFFTVLSSV